MSAIRIVRYLVRILGVLIALDGLFGFVFGLFLGQIRVWDWPVGPAAEALRLSDGRYAISVPNMNRIQIYTAGLEFQYGWPSKLHVDTLRLSPDGAINVYGSTKHHSDLYTFDINGNLLSSERWNHHDDPPPGQNPQPVNVADVPPSWTILLHAPLVSFLIMLVGAMTVSATSWRKSQKD